MRASYTWLKQLTGIEASADDYAKALTRAGIEVEAVEHRGAGLDHIVIAEVKGKAPHPTKDGLTLVQVVTGSEQHDIVCGAANVPAPGGKVLLAKMGAVLPGGMQIAERKVAGVVSRGMLCSEKELGLGEDSDGIFVCGAEITAPSGTPVAEALDLRDAIFEISLTPNRPDCLGHLGLARELAVAWRVPLKQGAALAHLDATGAASAEGVTVEIADPDRCPRYGAAVVRGVAIKPSPFAVRYRLANLGVRPISNIVDVTNLVMLERGHPIHAFDLAKVRGKRIVVRTAKDGEKLQTLDGEARSLTADDLLICDGEGAVALAGVMGGENSSISSATTDVLIECAYFDPRSVRRTSRRVGLHTDASHRFERGVDPNGVPAVLALAVGEVLRLAGGKGARAWVDANPKPIRGSSIRLRAQRMERVIGYAALAEEVTALLRGLGADVDEPKEGIWQVVAPTHRPDLTREEDLIEEVARVLGYDKIPTRAPRVRPSSVRTASTYRFERALRTGGVAAGLHEAVTYAFVDERSLVKARVAKAGAPAVRVENPLSEERNVLRSSLLPGLLECVARAQHRQVESAQLFEIGRVFAAPTGATLAKSPFLADERVMLGVILAGTHRDWVGAHRAVDFYDAKGAVEALARSVSRAALEAVALSEDEAPYLHPKRAAALHLGGEPVGAVGMLHPDVSDAFSLTGAVAYAELDLARLSAAVSKAGTPLAVALPAFPASSRDVALLVDAATVAEDVRRALAGGASDLAESVELFDLYEGGQLPAGKKSLAFRITYRDPAGTLTDDRVDAAHQVLADQVAAQFGAQRR
jgi:phenylalanyl-tRNA synthetase beta chain